MFVLQIIIAIAVGVLIGPFIYRGIFWVRTHCAEMTLNAVRFPPEMALARSSAERPKRDPRIDYLDTRYRNLRRALSDWEDVQWPWTSADKLR